jgi:hypothetical protein
MTAVIMALQPNDRVRQDSEPIALMYRTMGTKAAEEVVNRALAELTLAVNGLISQVQSHQLADVSRQLRRLSRMSDQLGMVSLCHVSGDARTCLEVGDKTAFAAVWARLMRVAERSLSTGGGLQDQSR